MRHDYIRFNGNVHIEEKEARFTEHERHTHDALEISIVLRNVIKYHLLHEDIIGRPGDVFLYRPFEPHWTLAEDGSKPVDWIMVLFLPSAVSSLPLGHHLLTPFYDAGYSPLIPASSPCAQRVKEMSERAIREKKERQPGWEAKIHIYVYDILIEIYRHYLTTQTDAAADRSDIPDIVNVIQHMMKHKEEKGDIDTLIRLTSMRKTRFYQRFKEITGLTPNQFMNRLRLHNAIHLLNHTQMPITEIAYDSGFDNVSYFNRCFKAYMGISPREHRKRLENKDTRLPASARR